MTLAIGAFAGDGSGVVLITDALTQARSWSGSRALLCMTPRFWPLNPAHGCAIVSGQHDAGWDYRSTSEDFDEATRGIFASARQVMRGWQLMDGAVIKPSTEVLASNGRQLVLLSTTKGNREAKPGQVIVAGASRDVLGESVTANVRTLSEARDVTLNLARTCVLTAYGRDGRKSLTHYLEDGLVPAMSPPFHVATITPVEIDMERIDQ